VGGDFQKMMHVMGRAASGGALAPEPPRATRRQPDCIRILNFTFHNFIFKTECPGAPARIFNPPIKTLKMKYSLDARRGCFIFIGHFPQKTPGRAATQSPFAMFLCLLASGIDMFQCDSRYWKM